MRKHKIYLETTLFNFYFDKDREAHADTVKLFNEIAAGKYEAFTSTYVTDELENAPQEKSEKMIGLITQYNISVLAPNDDTVRIAELYTSEGIIPKKYLTDGLHIAIATVNDLDMIDQHELSAYRQAQNENRNRKHKRFERLPCRGNLFANGGCRR